MSKKEKKTTPDYKAVSIGGWMITLLLSAIPGLNLILWIIWAFAAKRPSRKSFAIAMLIWTLILIVLVLLAACLFGQEILDWARSIDPELFTNLLIGEGTLR